MQFHCLDLNLLLVDFKICLKMLPGWPQFVWSHCKEGTMSINSNCKSSHVACNFMVICIMLIRRVCMKS